VTLVDTNVLLDVLTNDPEWVGWSIRQLDAAEIRGPLVINDIIYAELSVRFEAIETLDAAVEAFGMVTAAMPRSALFLAGRAFGRYRAAGGARTNVLPDFFVGAHAAVAGWPLLTRDPRRYRTYFPTVELIAP
jgi:predicted nucleic acid-binding protein